ncbi:MAG: LacI family DNA-binding transcriptional regulator [Rhodospirillales bacterium]|nr:LacI family DNA-binding transcriptional regulator [Rhodospirillales bacterium]
MKEGIPVGVHAAKKNARQEKAVGLRDVARMAGVSTATVSRVLNAPERVSATLRERVAAASARLGWVPDGAARALATRRSGAVGAVFPTLSHGDFARAAEALQGELTKRGYALLLACSHYDPLQEQLLVRQFVERGVDAVVLVGNVHDPRTIELLERRNVPYVKTFNYDPEWRHHSVGPDNRRAMRDLTRYLLRLGHRRFGMIAQSVDHNDRAAARQQGVRDALSEEGLSVRPHHFVEGRWSISEGRAAFRQIIKKKPWPTAVICGNAYLAIGAVLEAMQRGIKLPRDMSIVGYDDIEMMQELPVPITTLRVRSDEVGRLAGDYVLARLGGHQPSTDLECAVEIIERSSSGPAPRGSPRKVLASVPKAKASAPDRGVGGRDR